MLSTKGAYQSTNLVKFHVSSQKLFFVTLKSNAEFKEKLTGRFKS